MDSRPNRRALGAAPRAMGLKMGRAHAPPAPPPQMNRESYAATDEQGFVRTQNDPLSTFSIDVDTASYANVRRFIRAGQRPPVGAVRLEELINYFTYAYPAPTGAHPISLSLDAAPSPFHPGYTLARIGLKAKPMDLSKRPPSNLVFLLDVSGSMEAPNKLPLLQKALKLVVEQLSAQDRVSIVTYAGADRVALEPTPCSQKTKILAAIDQLGAGGSTHASSGIHTAYQLAERSLMPKGNNRVILATDGDFNVGTTSHGELQKLIEAKRKTGVFLTVLGFGSGNIQDDTMELLADKGNGNYAYIDSLLEAKKVLVKEMGGTLFTVGKDVKLQVEFNPATVGAYRLIGYDNRRLADEDFKNDKKDAGEIGAGHTVTALYELIPAGHPDVPKVDGLKYQKPAAKPTGSAELLTVKLRYKPKGSDTSTQLSAALKPGPDSLDKAAPDLRFAAAVAGFGLLLKDSPHKGGFTYARCLELVRGARGEDREGYRAELLRLVEAAELLQRPQAPSPTAKPRPTPAPDLRPLPKPRPTPTPRPPPLPAPIDR